MRKKRQPTVSLLVLALVLGTGCAEDPATGFDETVESRLTLDLSPLHPISEDGALLDCFSVASTVRLSVDGTPLPEQSASLGEQVTFFVEAPIGLVAFNAEVLSNNGTVLYTGQTRAMIEEDGFQVRLALTPQSPVMQLCLEPGEFSLEIANRGRGTLSWELFPPEELCSLNPPGPCVFFSPPTGEVGAGGTFIVNFDLPGNEPGPFYVRASSPVGDIAFQVSLPTARARPASPPQGPAFEQTMR